MVHQIKGRMRKIHIVVIKKGLNVDSISWLTKNGFSKESQSTNSFRFRTAGITLFIPDNVWCGKILPPPPARPGNSVHPVPPFLDSGFLLSE